LSIGQTGYLLSRAAGFVGNLSGPAHLSAALGTPTVTLMGGNSLPVEWAPVGDSLVLRVDVPCSPCHRRTCAGYGLACLYRLTPERVAPEIASFLRTRLPEAHPEPVGEPSLP
jgi:ADP-heptose:LPS heptosyltransferase